VAIDIDVEVQRALARHPNILWRRVSSPIRRRIRVFLRSRSQSDLIQLSLENENGIICGQFNADEIASFRDHRWLFIEDFLPNDFYLRVASDWPSMRWFQPLNRRQVSKTYDSAFKTYVKSEPDVLVPKALSHVYRFFSSKEFESQISSLSVDSESMQCYWLTTINSYWGSGLAPHRDTPDIDSSGRDRRINIIYFVDSNGEGWEAGGTAILATNNFSEPVFIPRTLKNSVLIYETGAPFFHGFPPIKFGKFRRVLTAHYKACD
jgi:hypothetical protein